VLGAAVLAQRAGARHGELAVCCGVPAVSCGVPAVSCGVPAVSCGVPAVSCESWLCPARAGCVLLVLAACF
jgi:hypothetical protein